MTISSFGDGQSILITTAGSFSGNKAEIRGILRSTGKALEVSCFHDYRERSDGFDAEEAFQLVHIFLVVVVFSKLLDPIIYPFQLFCKIVVAEKIR